MLNNIINIYSQFGFCSNTPCDKSISFCGIGSNSFLPSTKPRGPNIAGAFPVLTRSQNRMPSMANSLLLSFRMRSRSALLACFSNIRQDSALLPCLALSDSIKTFQGLSGLVVFVKGFGGHQHHIRIAV